MPTLVDILQALLTPVVAIVTTYIAYQQYRIKRDERSLELYDRRLAIFNRVIAIVDRVFSGETVRYEEAQDWINSVREADFLFGEEVEVAIDHLFKNVLDYAMACGSSHSFDLKCAKTSSGVELCRSIIIDAFSPYLRPAGSAAPRRPRLSKAQMLRRIKDFESKAQSGDAADDDDIPF